MSWVSCLPTLIHSNLWAECFAKSSQQSSQNRFQPVVVRFAGLPQGKLIWDIVNEVGLSWKQAKLRYQAPQAKRTSLALL